MGCLQLMPPVMNIHRILSWVAFAAVTPMVWGQTPSLSADLRLPATDSSPSLGIARLGTMTASQCAEACTLLEAQPVTLESVQRVASSALSGFGACWVTNLEGQWVRDGLPSNGTAAVLNEPAPTATCLCAAPRFKLRDEDAPAP